ncbi:MAG: DsrE family protein [Sulfuriferula sp.]
MAKSLIILHASPEAADNRALTALRLAGALIADDKEVTLFLVEQGAMLADPKFSKDNACHSLFYEMIEVGLQVLVCGATMRKMGWEEAVLLSGVSKSSMKALSALMTEATEMVSF